MWKEVAPLPCAAKSVSFTVCHGSARSGPNTAAHVPAPGAEWRDQSWLCQRATEVAPGGGTAHRPTAPSILQAGGSEALSLSWTLTRGPEPQQDSCGRAWGQGPASTSA